MSARDADEDHHRRGWRWRRTALALAGAMTSAATALACRADGYSARILYPLAGDLHVLGWPVAGQVVGENGASHAVVQTGPGTIVDLHPGAFPSSLVYGT